LPAEGAAVRVELLSYTSTGQLRDALLGVNLSDLDLLLHVSFTFAIEGISRACSHQLVRHRMASFSQQSQRYISVKKLRERAITPETIKKNAPELYSSYIEASNEAYAGLVGTGVPREDARFVLPNATETNMLMTMDGRSMYHFFGLRCCNRAQWEIRALADEMLSTVRAVEPDLFSKAGPYCYQLGYCPEGRFNCGKMNDVIERYRIP
jgi:thymidylate synthase (FAD)